MKLKIPNKEIFYQIDEEDFLLVSKHRWYLNSNGYVRTLTSKSYGSKRIMLHRLIMNASSLETVDHINGDKLDCRKENLRICSLTENNLNRPIRSHNSSGFKGVRLDKRRNKYVAEIRHNKKKYHLGQFENPIDAAKAYDIKAVILHGDFASLNFKKELP